MYNFLENYPYRNGLGYLIWATLSTSDCFDTEVYFFSPQSIFHLLLVWFEEFCVFDIRNYIFGRVIDGPAISRSLGIAPTGLPPSLRFWLLLLVLLTLHSLTFDPRMVIFCYFIKTTNTLSKICAQYIYISLTPSFLVSNNFDRWWWMVIQ